MIQKAIKLKRFSLTVNVDLDTLTRTYQGTDSSDLPTVESIVEMEMGWVNQSGIHLVDINELKD